MRTITTQRTAKPYKALRLTGHLVFCLGLAVGIYSSVPWGLTTCAVGLSLSGLGKMLAWWNHG